MKVFVTGVGGQLGYDVMNELKRRGHEAIGSDIIETAVAGGLQGFCAAELLRTDEAGR